MTDNERFSESVPEDVEGHGRIGFIDTQTGEDDVEGHMPRVKTVDTKASEDDVDTQAGEDDAEGHGYKGP